MIHCVAVVAAVLSVLKRLGLHQLIASRNSRKRDLIVAKSAGALIAMLYQKQIEERSRVISNFEIFDSQTIQQQFRELFKND